MMSKSRTGESSSNGRETELASASSASQHSQANMTIHRAMSSTTIEVPPDDRSKASGYGMALVGVAIEQDAAYWEAHIEVVAEQSTTESEVMLGVATKKDRQFFNDLQEKKGEIKRKVEARGFGTCRRKVFSRTNFFPSIFSQTAVNRMGPTTCEKSKYPMATWLGLPCSSRIYLCCSFY